MNKIQPQQQALNDEYLFRQSFHNYYENLHYYAYSIVKNSQEADDIVQSAYVKLWMKRMKAGLLNSAKPYLYTTVYRLSLNRLRDNKTKSKSIYDYNTFHEKHTPPDMQTRELSEKIQAGLDSLPPACRQVFLKSRLDQKTYQEIASELQVSIKTVESQMSKALKILRKALSDYLVIITVLIYLLTNG